MNEMVQDTVEHVEAPKLVPDQANEADPKLVAPKKEDLEATFEQEDPAAAEEVTA